MGKKVFNKLINEQYKDKKKLSLYVPVDLYNELKSEQLNINKTMNGFILEILKNYLKK